MRINQIRVHILMQHENTTPLCVFAKAVINKSMLKNSYVVETKKSNH
jgi:hypothetical protein